MYQCNQCLSSLQLGVSFPSYVKDLRYILAVRKVWRYSIVNENANTWPKWTGENDNQRSTKIAHKAKDLSSRNPPKTGMNSGALKSSSCSACRTLRTSFVTNPVINHGWEKNWNVITINGTKPWSFVIQTLRNG